MLRELHIENVAVIERANLELGPGLNILTGETGAGKSILVDAMHAILGARKRRSSAQHSIPTLARHGAKKTRSSATMNSSSAARLRQRARRPAASAVFRSRRRSCARWVRCCSISTARTTVSTCSTSGSTCAIWTGLANWNRSLRAIASSTGPIRRCARSVTRSRPMKTKRNC